MGRPEIGYHPGRAPENNVLSFLQRHLEGQPDRVALRWVPAAARAAFAGDVSVPLPHEEVSYGAFAQLIAHTAAGLGKLGVGPGDRVLIFLPMGMAMCTAMFAVQRLGAIAVFLDSWARSEDLGACARCVEPKAMISRREAFELARKVPELAAVPIRVGSCDDGRATLSAWLEELMADPGEAPIAAVAPDQPALVTFTTAPTGALQGANRTHRFLSAQHQALRRIIPYEPGDLDLPAFLLFSVHGLASGVSTLVPAIDLAAPSPRDGAALTCQIRHERVTCATLSPSLLVKVAVFCAERGETLPTLRRVVTAGGPIGRDDLQRFRAVAPAAEVWAIYGSPEVEPMAHIEAREMIALSAPPSDAARVDRGLTVGRLSEDLRWKFLRPSGDDGPVHLGRNSWSELEVPAGEVGELVVSGDHVCRDYYNNPEAFSRTKILDADGTVWHRTGDLARLDERGYLHVVGRVNDPLRRGE